MMPRVMKHWSLWIHICQVLVTIGIIYGTTVTTLEAHGEQIKAIKEDGDKKEVAQTQNIEKIKDDVISVKVDVSAIKQSVQDIKDALNIRHREDR
jgi:hypothetical protein